VQRAAHPHEVLLVADSLTGQDAVNLARAFDQRVGLTGIVLTRVSAAEQQQLSFDLCRRKA
jgi:signal recognition particle subunit SRP54